MTIDHDTLIDTLTDIVNGEISPVNPVLVFNAASGEFSIQSDLNPMNADEHIISGQLNTSDGLDAFLGDLASDEVAEFVGGMTDEYITEYVIGDIDQ